MSYFRGLALTFNGDHRANYSPKGANNIDFNGAEQRCRLKTDLSRSGCRKSGIEVWGSCEQNRNHLIHLELIGS
jgi:hypothetical protein